MNKPIPIAFTVHFLDIHLFIKEMKNGIKQFLDKELYFILKKKQKTNLDVKY